MLLGVTINAQSQDSFADLNIFADAILLLINFEYT